MVKQNYENYHKEYYQVNKDEIRNRVRAYRRLANRRYYEENKDRIMKKRLETKLIKEEERKLKILEDFS